MDGYHSNYLEWMVSTASAYNERLPQHLLTMDGYHNINLQGTLPYHICTMDGYQSINLQLTVAITLYCPFHTKSFFYSFLEVISCTIFSVAAQAFVDKVLTTFF